MEAEKKSKNILSDTETEHNPQDIYNVPANLKLQRKSMNFTVFDMQEELAFQSGQPDKTFISSNKKRKPIQRHLKYQR